MMEGVSETLAAFDRYQAQVQREMRAAVGRAINRIASDARSRCPVSNDPKSPFAGLPHVRDLIGTQLVGGNDPMGAVFVERAGLGGFYGTDNRGLWIEYGTDIRYNKMGDRRGQVYPRPFMGPAVETERPRHLADLQAVLERAAKGF